MKGLLTAFPRSIEELRPALHLAKDIGSPFVIVVGQVMPLAVADMAEVIRAWLGDRRRRELPIQFETHRNCITNDLFSTLLLLDAVPEMRLSADLSHYVVDREMMQPISAEYQGYVGRILERSDSFQGRVANRCQVQLPLHFPQHRVWIDTFLDWWRRGFASWRRRAAPDQDCIFLCELGPRDYAITDAQRRGAVGSLERGASSEGMGGGVLGRREAETSLKARGGGVAASDCERENPMSGRDACPSRSNPPNGGSGSSWPPAIACSPIIR